MLRAIMILILSAALAGCATTPRGYDSDTTPDHDGEEWVGGQ